MQEIVHPSSVIVDGVRTLPVKMPVQLSLLVTNHPNEKIRREREKKENIYGQRNRSKHDGYVLFTALSVPIYLRERINGTQGRPFALPLFLRDNLIFHFF